jgi:hypothetical protein
MMAQVIDLREGRVSAVLQHFAPSERRTDSGRLGSIALKRRMSDEELKAELERLLNENAALKKGASSGAVSIYGIGVLDRRA